MSLEFFVIVFVIITSVLWYLKRGSSTKTMRRTQKTVAQRSQLSTAKIRSINTVIQAPVRLIPEINNNQNSVVKNSNDLMNFTLLPFDALDRNQQQKINEISQCCRQPNPLLLNLTSGELEAKELISLIKSDPEMTAKIINTVNSSLFSLRQPIESIHHAIIFMGVTSVRSIALQFILQQSVPFKDEAQSAAYKRIWLSSYIASSLVFLIAKHLNKENAAELSTLCLLTSLGDMTMLSYQPSIANTYMGKTSLLERVESVQSSLGLNSAVIGKALAEQWQLPKSIVSGLANSLSPLINNKLNRVMPHEEAKNTLLCYLACRLGDLIAFEGVSDIFKVENEGLAALSSSDFAYIQTNIEQLELEQISQLFRDPSFISKAKRLIAQVVA